MNSDEINSLVTKIVLSVLSVWLGTGIATQSQEQTIAAGIGALAAIAYGTYMHWNMKKVPENSIVTLPEKK